jgi:hypothetical protein
MRGLSEISVDFVEQFLNPESKYPGINTLDRDIHILFDKPIVHILMP